MQDKEKPKYYNDFELDEIETILEKYPELDSSDKKQLRILQNYLIAQRDKHVNTRTDILGSFPVEDLLNFRNDVINSKPKKIDPYKSYNKEAIKLLKKVAKNLGIESISSDQFVLGAAYAYLKEKGWNENIESVDNEICRTYNHATHGSKSKIMTLCEKYIWCFKHEIYGYLSDLITPRIDEDLEDIDDYGLLISDLINPAQEIYNVEENISQECYIPESLSPELPNITNSIDGIKKWIQEAPFPKFENWIEIKNYKPLLEDSGKQWLNLYSYNVIKEPNLKTQTILSLNSLIISKELFPIFMEDIKNKRKKIYNDLSYVHNLCSQTLSDCYITPKEICQMSWKVNCCEKLTYRGISNNKIVEYKLIKSIEQCTANYAKEGEKQYQLPSKYIRELLNIADGNGVTYINKNNEIVAQCFKYGSLGEEQQEFLCVNKDLLLDKLNAKNEKIVWVVNIQRKPSYICYEKYKNLHVYKDSTWIVWFDAVHQNWQDYCFVEETKI